MYKYYIDNFINIGLNNKNQIIKFDLNVDDCSLNNIKFALKAFITRIMDEIERWDLRCERLYFNSSLEKSLSKLLNIDLVDSSIIFWGIKLKFSTFIEKDIVLCLADNVSDTVLLDPKEELESLQIGIALGTGLNNLDRILNLNAFW